MADPIADLIMELDQSEPQASAPQAMQVAEVTADPVDSMLAELEAGPVQGLQAQRAEFDNSTPTDTVQGSGTPDDPFRAIVKFSEMIQKARKVGEAGFRESALGHAVKSGKLSLDQAEAQFDADGEIAAATGDIAAYEKESWNSWITGIPTSIALGTVKQLPMLEESLKVSVAGFGIGGGATAATGVGTAVAIPVGSMVGVASAAAWQADFVSGQEYLQQRRRGIPHKEAAIASTISGMIQGALGGLQFGHAAKLPISSAKSVMTAHAQSLLNFVTEGLKFTGVQLSLAEAQTAVKIIMQSLAGTVSKKPGAVPTVKEATEEFRATLEESLKSGVGLFLGGKVVGHAAGFTAKSFMKGLKKVGDTHLEKQAAKLEALKEAETAEAAKPDAEQTAKKPADSPESAEPSKAAQEKTRQKAEKLQKREAAEKEVKRIFDAAASLFRIESDETRLQETNRIQRLLKRMVSNSDLLDDATKVKLLKRIVEIDGEKALLREGERFIEEQRGREHSNMILKAKVRLDKAIKAGQQKGKKAALPEAAQQSLKWYKEFFTEPKIKKEKGGPKREPGEAQELARQAALKKATDYVEKGMQEEATLLEQQLDKLENNEVAEIFNQPAGLLEKRRIAMQAQRFWGGALDPKEIETLAGQVEEMVKTGKSEFLERKQTEASRLLDLRARIKDGVNGIKPVVPSVETSAPKEMTGFGKFLNSVRRNSSSLWDKLLQDTPAEAREKLIRDVLDLTAVENKEFDLNQKASEKLTELYEKATGSMREASKLIRDGSKNELFEIPYTDSDGKSQILGRYSLNELAYLHMAMEDPGAVPGLVHGNKFTLEGMVEIGQTSTQEAIKRVLQERADGKYLKLAGAVRDFYRWFAPTIGNHYLQEYGVTLPMNDNYSGQIFHRHLERMKSATDILQDAHQFAQRSLDPGSVKERSNSRLPVKAVDPFQQVQRHRGDMNFWIANSKKARELSFIFSDSTKDGLRDVIQHKLGREFTSLIDSRIAFQFHLKPGIMDIADRPLQNVKNNLATGLLGARIDQAPKQWTSILGALSTNTYAEFVDGLRGATDKQRLQEYLSLSDVYKERQNSILPQILEATQDRSYTDAITGDRALAIKEFFLVPMAKWGDGVASAITGFIEFNRVRKAGGSIEEAVKAGDSLVDRSQSSSRQSQKVPAEFKGGLSNFSLSFAKQNIQFLNLESGAIRDALIHKDAKHLNRMARTIVGIHAAQALFQAINSTPAWVVGEDREKGDAAIRVLSATVFGSYTSLPLLGTDLFYGALSGWKGQQAPRTIIGGLTGDATKMIKRTWTIVDKLSQGEDIEGEYWVKSFQGLAGLASVATGIPFWGLFRNANFGREVIDKAQGKDE